MIYLNAGSHGIPHASVYQRMIDHLTLEQEVGPARAFEQVQSEYAQVRDLAARLMSAKAEDVAFSTSATAAWEKVVRSLDFKSTRMLVAPHEWEANVTTLKKMAKDKACEIEVLPYLVPGSDDVSSWQERIDDDVCAIFVPMITSITGQRYPVEAIGKMERPEHCRYVIDAAQALGQRSIDVGVLGCDALVATTRKWLRGPRQSAVIWASQSIFGHVSAKAPQLMCASNTFDPMMDVNVAIRLGLGCALNLALDQTIEHVEAGIQQLVSEIRRCAAALNIEVLSSGKRQTGSTTLGISSTKVDAIKKHLEMASCVVKWPILGDEPLAEGDFGPLVPLRLSPHVYNSLDDVRIAFGAIEKALITRH